VIRLLKSMSFTRRRIFASGLFDVDWYKLAHPYVVRDKIDPLTHFLKHGRRLRLAPSRLFDAGRYLDDSALASRSRLNPLVHYLAYGKKLNIPIHQAPASGADRILESGLFDSNWYLRENPDVLANGYPPLLHYMVHGALEGRSPGPDFDAKWYLHRYPDIVGINPLLHYIDFGQEEGRTAVRPERVFSIARETIAGIEDLDPDLYATDYFDDIDHIDVVDGRPRTRMARAFEKLIATIDTPPKAIVFLPWLVHGGADLVAAHAIRAMSDKHGSESVVAVICDHDRLEAIHLLPKGVKHLSLLQIEPNLSHVERIELIDLIIRGLRPSTVLNVNSRSCWDAIKRYGNRLQNFTRLYAMLFCPDFSVSGRRSGYADLYLRQCLPFLAGVYFDNSSYIDQLTQQFSVPAELQSKLVTLYQPAPNVARNNTSRHGNSRLRVMWAGRLMPQKNVDLLMRIAEQTQQFEFHIWGRGSHALELQLSDLSRRIPYIHFHGPFERFEALPTSNYDVLLYTSLWDGLPNVLLEAAAAGLTIVASNVGGISELIDGSTGWLVNISDEASHYIDALSEIAMHPAEAQRRIDAMDERLAARHNWERYQRVLTQEPTVSKGFLYVSTNDYGDFKCSPGGNACQIVDS
jgi:glycosyltransferase involved in cell wall biosynthesis